MQYLGERFQMERFMPLACIFYLAYLLCVNFSPAMPLYFIMILLLILSFRLMDDLFDLQLDRENFPGRTLARTDNPRLFIMLLIILDLLLVSVLVWEKEFLSLVFLLTTIFFLCLWYAKLRYIFTSKLLHAMVVLLKYPVILYIVAPGLGRPEIPVLIYLTFVIFETADDPHLKTSIMAKGIRTLGLFVYLAIFFLLLALPSKSMASWLVLFLASGLQLLAFSRKNSTLVYIPFINTLLLFAFLSARYYLQ